MKYSEVILKINPISMKGLPPRLLDSIDTTTPRNKYDDVLNCWRPLLEPLRLGFKDHVDSTEEPILRYEMSMELQNPLPSTKLNIELRNLSLTHVDVFHNDILVRQSLFYDEALSLICLSSMSDNYKVSVPCFDPGIILDVFQSWELVWFHDNYYQDNWPLIYFKHPVLSDVIGGCLLPGSRFTIAVGAHSPLEGYELLQRSLQSLLSTIDNEGIPPWDPDFVANMIETVRIRWQKMCSTRR